MRMRVSYLKLSWSWTVLLPSDIYKIKPISPLQPFYFHLWPIYWLSLVFLFIYGLYYDAASSRPYSVKWYDDCWIMNFKDAAGAKFEEPSWNLHAESTTELTQDHQSPGPRSIVGVGSNMAKRRIHPPHWGHCKSCQVSNFSGQQRRTCDPRVDTEQPAAAWRGNDI
jgi:hypothetical protein